MDPTFSCVSKLIAKERRFCQKCLVILEPKSYFYKFLAKGFKYFFIFFGLSLNMKFLML